MSIGLFFVSELVTLRSYLLLVLNVCVMDTYRIFIVF